jgi:uncharacterized membrane protein
VKITAQVLSAWESTRTSYWFVPSLLAASALALSFLMLEVDARVSDRWIRQAFWFYTGSPEGARSVLSTIASSMITVAGAVFSIMIVAMTLASNQFGPRLLRNFMRDVSNQIVLGTFVATFLYCLLVLRTVHGPSETGPAFIPHASMVVAVLLALAGLGVLIYFIHHAAASIQAPNVIGAVARDLHAAIDELYPQRAGEGAVGPDPPGRSPIPERFDEDAAEIRAEEGGYVEFIQIDDIMAEAAARDLVLRLEHRPGQYVQADDVIMRAWPRDRASQDACRTLRQTFTISDQRTLAQDAEFAMDQLVEIAARALSPGMNDPFTAMQCVDRLGEALSHLARRVIPSPYRLDGAGRLRVIAYPVQFCDFVDAAFNQIRQDSARSLAVMIRLLEAIGRVGRQATGADRACLSEHARMVYEQALGAATADRDRRKVEERYRAVARTLGKQ